MVHQRNPSKEKVAVNTENRNNRSLLYKIGGILMIATCIGMIIGLVSSIGTVQDNFITTAIVSPITLIGAIILFTLARRK